MESLGYYQPRSEDSAGGLATPRWRRTCKGPEQAVQSAAIEDEADELATPRRKRARKGPEQAAQSAAKSPAARDARARKASAQGIRSAAKAPAARDAEPVAEAQAAESVVTPLATRDAKPIVDEIKARLKGKKFYPGSHAEPCSVRFSTPRFPLDVARRLLGVGADGKPAARTLKGDQIAQALRLKPDALKATLYKKPHRFSKPGATATRWGTAPLKLLSMEVSYKAGSLRGHVRCINAPDPERVGPVSMRLMLERLMAERRSLQEGEMSGPAAAPGGAVGLPGTPGAEVAKQGSEHRRDETSAIQERPSIGDIVEILGTRHIRNCLPDSIGRRVTISADDKGACPFRVCYQRSEAPYPFYAEDVRLVSKAAAGEPRRILEFRGYMLKVVCPDSTTFGNFHRVLQTCIQACKGVNAADFHFEFGGKSVSSDGAEDAKSLSELKVGDVVTYSSQFNSTYGKRPMHLRVTGACVAPHPAAETPWQRPGFLDEGFLPRCAQATSDRTRDAANWRLCHMRFDLAGVDRARLEEDDLMMMRWPDHDGRSFLGAFTSPLRRRGPSKFLRVPVVQRMSLDLAGELDAAKAGDGTLSDVRIER